VGCIPEYVEDECTGLVIPPGNPEALAKALERLLSDSQLWGAMSRNAKEAADTRFANGPLIEGLLAAALKS
jgi:glycosyltransferase involved in cell wall biosynthesis